MICLFMVRKFATPYSTFAQPSFRLVVMYALLIRLKAVGLLYRLLCYNLPISRPVVTLTLLTVTKL